MKFLLACLITVASFNANAYFTLTSYSVDFWNVKVGDYFGKSAEIYIYNRDNKNIDVDFHDNCFFDVKVRTRYCRSVSPNASCDLEIQFAPRAAGPMRCSVTLYDTAGWQERVFISGNGVE